MRMRSAFLLSLTVLSIAADKPKDAPSDKEQARLQGTWKLESVESDINSPALPDNPPRWVIKGNKVFYGGDELAVLTLDGTANPKTVDVTLLSPKKIFEGIYEIEKDTLKICVNRRTEGVKERPTDFKTEGNPDRKVLVFKREKDPKGDPTEGLQGFVGIAIRVSPEQMEVVIGDVVESSPAMKSGLKKDDVLLQVGNRKATDLRTTIELVRQQKPGSEVAFRIRRGDKEQDVKVKIGAMPFYYLD